MLTSQMGCMGAGKCIGWGKAESLGHRYWFSCSQQLCEAGTVSIYILQVRKLRHREDVDSPKVTWLLKDGAQI